MNTDFELLKKIISIRRTVKPAGMNGASIAESDIKAILQLADWAPTHGRTEPWRFIVFEGDKLQAFSKQHAALYKQFCDPELFKEDKFEKLIHNGLSASHLIVVVMKRTPSSKIKPEEEYAAVAAAVQNMLLGAAALGIAAIWSTGGMATHKEMKALLGLNHEDCVVAFVYLGYTDKPLLKGIRQIPLSEKTDWNK